MRFIRPRFPLRPCPGKLFDSIDCAEASKSSPFADDRLRTLDASRFLSISRLARSLSGGRFLATAILVVSTLPARADELDGAARPPEAPETTRESISYDRAHPKFPVEELRFWFESMAVHHRYTVEEMKAASGLSVSDIEKLLHEHGIESGSAARPTIVATDALLVLPYPGGRHPRIGFLDGALDPHRDSKISVFLPWKDAGYVVVDLPEAQWATRAATGRELIYLAHTHIPTRWDRLGKTLAPVDWSRLEKGVLEARRTLPDGVEFFARVEPSQDAVDMELAWKNGSAEALADLRTQICVLLKGAPDFDATTNDNKVIDGDAVAVRAESSDRWIVTAWQDGRGWANAPCPCLHSDPLFPDLAPGRDATLRGRLFFYEGTDVRAEVARRRKEGSLFPAARKVQSRPADLEK
jgi:hypothetical protein